jgi:estrogen-related receptor beta like 1
LIGIFIFESYMAEQDEGEKGAAGPQNDPGLMVEELIDILKVLNYEETFLSSKGFRPLTRCHFTSASVSSQDNFQYFTALFTWLLSLNGASASFNKYDDPGTIANNITVELSKLGLNLDFPPQKLRSGVGEAPCLILLSLAKRALQSKKVKFSKPVFPKEKEIQGEVIGGEDDDLEDNLIEEDDFEEAVFAEVKAGQPVAEEENEADNAPIWSSVDPNEWLLEVERVGPRLKFAADPTGGDSREWRLHLEQTKQLKANILKELPETEAKLKRIADDLSKCLERISAQERKINTSMGEITGNYRVQANSLNEVQLRYKQSNENVAELSSQLQQINERIEEIQDKIDRQGKVVTNNSPLQGIKEAFKVLKAEIRDMELRGAVLSHALFQAKLKEKSN